VPDAERRDEVPDRDPPARDGAGVRCRVVCRAESSTVPFEQIGQSAVNRLCRQKSEFNASDRVAVA
jgi:hypothetical protein